MYSTNTNIDLYFLYALEIRTHDSVSVETYATSSEALKALETTQKECDIHGNTDVSFRVLEYKKTLCVYSVK